MEWCFFGRLGDNCLLEMLDLVSLWVSRVVLEVEEGLSFWGCLDVGVYMGGRCGVLYRWHFGRSG